MTANHPYPKHVMEAVAVAILNYYEYLDGRNMSAVEIANAALTGLWEASRIDSVDDIEDIPENAVVLDQSGFVVVGREHAAPDIHYEDYPVHVLHWGNHDR